MDTTTAIYRCPHCCAIPPAPHAADCPERAPAAQDDLIADLRGTLRGNKEEITRLSLRNGQLEALLITTGRDLMAAVPAAPLPPTPKTSEWHTFVNPPAMTIHTRDVGGVLCRWWGDGPVPAGVALIDAAAAAVGRDAALSNAVTDVLAERQRQQDVEGWTIAHDDMHNGGQMPEAAACYITGYKEWSLTDKRQRWPWALRWWKPKDRRHNLVRAGALVLAEIERLDRAATKGGAA